MGELIEVLGMVYRRSYGVTMRDLRDDLKIRMKNCFKKNII